MPISTRIEVKNAGPGTLEILSKLWHRQWYAGYTPASHHDYRMRTLTTPWAREHVQVLSLEEERRVCSGMIVLSLTMVIAGKRRKVGGIAAVVTDPDQRGRGFAARLLTVGHRRLADSGHDAAMLFSEIGTEYYARLGYIPWPVTRHVLALPRGAGERRGLSFAPATSRDLGAQATLYRELQSRFDVRVLRTSGYWRHLVNRARWKDEVLAPEGGAPKKHVAHRFIARLRGKPVACARILPREADVAVTEAGYLPGHASSLVALIARRAAQEERAAASIVADASIVAELGLPVEKSEAIDKMMFVPLANRLTPAQLAPAPCSIWPEDWF